MKLNATSTNFETLETIAADAIKSLETSNRADKTRWINAIKKSVVVLQENCYWNYSDGELVMMSTTSGTTYTPNGVCQCEAYARQMPCRHRSAHRLHNLLADSLRREKPAQ